MLHCSCKDRLISFGFSYVPLLTIAVSGGGVLYFCLQYPALVCTMKPVCEIKDRVPGLDVLWVIAVQSTQMVRKLPRYTDVHFNAQTPAP